MKETIEASVIHLQWIFTIVMSLAITEGLKQFVKDIKDSDEGTSSTVRWHCTGGLVAFLLTVMPFTYGMSRYFFDAYRRGLLGHGPFGPEYFWHLSLDSAAFTLEAICFFIMSRSISPRRSLAFSLAALLVFVVDILWVVKCEKFGAPSGVPLNTWWIVQDPMAIGALVIVLLAIGVYCFFKRPSKIDYSLFLHLATCTILIVEAVVDLALNRTFYFPA